MKVDNDYERLFQDVVDRIEVARANITVSKEKALLEVYLKEALIAHDENRKQARERSNEWRKQRNYD